MGLAKLTAGHVAIIGAVLAILCGATFFYLGPYKTQENIAAVKSRIETADRELAKETNNKKDLNKAKQEVAEVKAQFAVYDKTLMPQPPIDLTKPTDETAMTKSMIRLWGQPYEICTISNRFARESAKQKHVTLLSPPFSIAGQTTDPAAIPTAIIIFPLGTVQVSGSFQNVNNYMKSWNRFKRVVAVDGFQMSVGPNPNSGNTSVTGQANLTCYVFPHASENAVGGAPGADT